VGKMAAARGTVGKGKCLGDWAKWAWVWEVQIHLEVCLKNKINHKSEKAIVHFKVSYNSKCSEKKTTT
jgi:hypothetical protein